MGNQHGSYDVDHNLPPAEPEESINMDECGLHVACTRGDLIKVKELFKDAEQLKEVDEEDKTPLMCAVKSGHLNIVQFLLNKVGNLNFEDSCSKTTLHFACEEGALHIVKWLLENGADANAKDISDTTPIHLASKLEDQDKKVEIIKHLLDHGADPKLQDCNAESAVDLAFQQGNVALVKLFHTHNFEIDLYKTDKSEIPAQSKTGFVEGHNLLYVAVKGGHQDLVTYLKDTGVDFKDRKTLGFELFSIACTSNNIDFIKFVSKTFYKEELGDDTKTNAIFTAATQCEVPVVKLLLDMGYSFDVLNAYMETPLLSAIICSRLENVQLLLESGADPCAARFDGKTALHLYCQNIREAGPVLVSIVLGTKDINLTDAAQRTPLHYAAMEGATDVIKFLVKHGADRNALDPKKATALHYLSGSNGIHWDTEAFECLTKDFDIEALDEQQKTPLHYAADNAPFGYFENLVNRGANLEAVSDDKGSVLHHALATHHWSQAQFLLEKGVYNDNPNKDGRTPLLYSVRSVKLTEMLLDRGANIHAVDKEAQTALHLACQGVKLMSEYTGEEWSLAEEVVELLLIRGANINSPDKRGRTPLHIAYNSTNEKVINILLSHGADKTAIDDDGRNILHYAAQSFVVDIVKGIFDTNLNVPDHNGHRPLFYSCDIDTLKYLLENTDNVKPDEFHSFFPFGFYFSVECLKMVFERGASIDVTDEKGNTMLHKYIEYGLTEEVKYLLEQGADVNVRNKDLVTPLHVAVDQMSFECVQLLVDHGAYLAAEDKEHRNALDYARESKTRDEQMVVYLTEKFNKYY